VRSSTTDGSSKRGRKRRKSSDDESDFDDEEDSIANPLVLAGATGVGKTALVRPLATRFLSATSIEIDLLQVHALADELGMRVIEMSSNERRATAQLRQKLTGATHTHRVCPFFGDSVHEAR
jgi:MoxR-like ATPase